MADYYGTSLRKGCLDVAEEGDTGHTSAMPIPGPVLGEGPLRIISMLIRSREARPQERMATRRATVEDADRRSLYRRGLHPFFQLINPVCCLVRLHFQEEGWHIFRSTKLSNTICSLYENLHQGRRTERQDHYTLRKA
ncbi:hypothetical protein QR78_14580 [Methylobacterium indicum]|uniref:Uncharacterized protein n=1 Tax=Methylobacterium indicum TaxID=1775910 RepID=A0ABR5HHU3_9HYPH|nr:hypothetical protein QR78_14580 [Methylobacterium indicum]KMO26172.1 hypothetical protein QR79_03865 [Methylobacterium indicum]